MLFAGVWIEWPFLHGRKNFCSYKAILRFFLTENSTQKLLTNELIFVQLLATFREILSRNFLTAKGLPHSELKYKLIFVQPFAAFQQLFLEAI